MIYDTVIASVRQDVQRGLSVDDTIVALRASGLSIVQSMKALMELHGMSLEDAKAEIHPVWAGVVKAAEPLHDDLEAYAKKMSYETGKAWIEAGKLLVEDPAVRVQCPEKADSFLTVHDEVSSQDPTRFERHLVCDVCGARNILLLHAPAETE